MCLFCARTPLFLCPVCNFYSFSKFSFNCRLGYRQNWQNYVRLAQILFLLWIFETWDKPSVTPAVTNVNKQRSLFTIQFPDRSDWQMQSRDERRDIRLPDCKETSFQPPERRRHLSWKNNGLFTFLGHVKILTWKETLPTQCSDYVCS